MLGIRILGDCESKGQPAEPGLAGLMDFYWRQNARPATEPAVSMHSEAV